jgi:hypothetical protein
MDKLDLVLCMFRSALTRDFASVRHLVPWLRARSFRQRVPAERWVVGDMRFPYSGKLLVFSRGRQQPVDNVEWWPVTRRVIVLFKRPTKGTAYILRQPVAIP